MGGRIKVTKVSDDRWKVDGEVPATLKGDKVDVEQQLRDAGFVKEVDDGKGKSGWMRNEQTVRESRRR